MIRRFAVAVCFLAVTATPAAAQVTFGFDALQGRWLGEVVQPSYGIYPVELKIADAAAGDQAVRVTYPTLACGGGWIPVGDPSQQVGHWRLIEHVAGGDCVPVGVVDLYRAADGSLFFAWREDEGREPSAWGRLTRHEAMS